MTAFRVETGNGYADRGGTIHQTDTLDSALCCDRACGFRYLAGLGIDTSDLDTAGQLLGEPVTYVDGRPIETGDRASFSWGYSPCAGSPSDAYCPACGARTADGYEKADDDSPALDYTDPDPCIAVGDRANEIARENGCSFTDAYARASFERAHGILPKEIAR